MQDKCGLFFCSYRAESALFPSGFQKACLAAFLLALIIIPLGINSYYVSILCLMNIAVIGAVSLNLLTGLCGQISLGHGAFFGVGAYTAGILAAKGVPFLLVLPASGAVAAMAGMAFGLPSLRLKGIYLAIASLAAQLILEYVFLHWESMTGGSNGLMVMAPEIFGLKFDSDIKMFYLTLAVAALTVLAVSNITRTRPGRAFVAIRDHYLSAEIVGVNLFAGKLQAFGLSSFLAGVGGCLWAHYTNFITPEQFNIGLSINYLAMIIIGGLGSVLGAIFGAVFLTVLPEALNAVAALAGQLLGGDPTASLAALKGGVFGLVLTLFLIFEPDGLAQRWRMAKAYWKLYPFAH